jgi:nicotinamidase-related amidase
MWDRHWCRSAAERVDSLAVRINEVLRATRRSGALIIHAPSETMEYYEGTPARLRAIHAPPAASPTELPHDDPALPIDDSDGGCDGDNNPGEVNERLWTRQHSAIAINQDLDVISDEGMQIYNVLQEQGIQRVLLMGVHTNMCILNRSFGIKQLISWGVDVMLCRDLTDSMYNPEKPPYVGHDKGTDLVVGYIESHWCPTIHSNDLLIFT